MYIYVYVYLLVYYALYYIRISIITCTIYISVLIITYTLGRLVRSDTLHVLIYYTHTIHFVLYLYILHSCLHIHYTIHYTPRRLVLSDTWCRDFQTLPGRVRPDMYMSTSGGFILTGVYVGVVPSLWPFGGPEGPGNLGTGNGDQTGDQKGDLGTAAGVVDGISSSES
ncbi:hypothetical protein B484DRAFT_338759 [Ochromonadaceae sp. CCMP2298]|nr:hypothetical protein B484DRAFT_338759 [Ochromonadaceae sp. CCMP2298]